MALTGFSNTVYLSRASAIKATIPIYISCWLYRTTNSVFGFAGAIGISGSGLSQVSIHDNDNNHAMAISVSSANVEVSADIASPTVPATTWFHQGGLWLSTTFRKSYWNANTATNTTSNDPATLSYSIIGNRAQRDSAWANSNGLAEFSYWDATGWAEADSDALDVKTRAGQNPININAEAGQAWSGKLLCYVIDSANTITDLSGNGRDFTATGTPPGNFATGHPTIDAPGSPVPNTPIRPPTTVSIVP